MRAKKFMLWILAIILGWVSFDCGMTSVADETRWEEKPALETPGWLPSSAAYSPDGQLLVLGGPAGEVAAFEAANRQQKWKATLGDGFAAVTLSADGDSILATHKDGVRFLDPETGKLGDTIEEKESRPTAIAVFPDRKVGEGGTHLSHKVVFGNAERYFVKIWIAQGHPGGIELGVAPAGKEPADPHAVPLAVDPRGRSVILTGPVHRETGKNVLWAWVAGDYDEGTPGNRLLEGHDATVVSAAWSKDGKTAVTGDSEGSVIVWDAQTMKETHRRDLGDRVAAVAITPDGNQIAAIAIGKEAKYFVWNASDANADAKPLAVDTSDFGGPSIRACLAFSPDGRQLVGSAINLVWLTRLGELTGKLRVWDAAAE